MSEVTLRRRVAVGLAFGAALCGALGLLGTVLLGGSLLLHGLFPGGFAVIFAVLAFDVVVYASAGAALAIRRPENRVGTVLLAGAVLLGVTFNGFIGGGVLAETRGVDDSIAGFVALAGGLTIGLTLIVAGPLLGLVFPDGRLPSPRWRWPVALLAVAIVADIIPGPLQRGSLGNGMPNNPLPVPDSPSIDTLASVAGAFGGLAIPSALMMAVVAVIVRYRRSAAAEREQLKWFVGANVLVAVLLGLSLADGASDEPTAFDALAVGSLALPPLAIAVAVLRYRLYEIDRIISRTIAYGLLTGVLVACYAGAILLLQSPLGSITGGDTIAVALSTLVVAGLFQPVRKRIQHAVDQRFDRARFDAERTSAAFAERLRDEVDIEAVSDDLRATVTGSIKPTALALWLREGGR